MTGFESKRNAARDKLTDDDDTQGYIAQYEEALLIAYQSGFADGKKSAQPEPLEYWNAVEGWVKIDEVREHFNSVGCGTIYKSAGEDRVPLYTAPAQRTWVGLTEEDWAKIGDMPDAFDQGAAWAAARLKAKNDH